MKNYRFWFGVAFGYASGHLLDALIDWPMYVSMPIFLTLFFATQHVVHKIAES